MASNALFAAVTDVGDDVGLDWLDVELDWLVRGLDWLVRGLDWLDVELDWLVRGLGHHDVELGNHGDELARLGQGLDWPRAPSIVLVFSKFRYKMPLNITISSTNTIVFRSNLHFNFIIYIIYTLIIYNDDRKSK